MTRPQPAPGEVVFIEHWNLQTRRDDMRSHKKQFNHLIALSLALIGMTSTVAPRSYSLSLSALPTLASEAIALPTTAEPRPANADELNCERASEALGRLPLRYEANRGQTDRAVKFIARGAGFDLLLTSTEAVLRLAVKKTKQATAGNLRMKMIGSNPSPQITGMDQLPGQTNYFIGADSSKWITSVPSFARVRYNQIYPGIDMVYYSKERQLEYDFIVAPGADPASIALAFEGARKTGLNPSGDLVVKTAGSDLRLHKPFVYQETDGARREIASRYVLKKNRQVGLEVAAYDHSRPLIIDPVLSYATYLGGGSDDEARGIAVDSAGNIHVTGTTRSVDFPLQNPADSSNAGCFTRDAFVTKLSPDGSQLIYSTFLGGSDGGASCSFEAGNGIAVDASGSAYITGVTNSSDYPVSFGAFQTHRADGGDAFVTKLSPAGAIVYSTYLGGISPNIFGDEGRGIAVDSAGNAYVAGSTGSQDNPFTSTVNEGFPTTAGAFQSNHVRTANEDSLDGFVTKLNAAGSGLVYSSYLAGNGFDTACAIAVNSNGEAYVTGQTLSTDFHALNAFQAGYGGTGQSTTNGAGGDAFITKVNSSGGGLVYSSYLGGSRPEIGYAIAVDAAGDAYLAGSVSSSDFPATAGAFKTAKPGSSNDGFVTKVSSTGVKIYATYLGGDNQGDEARGIAIDSAGNAYVTGFADSFNFPLVNPINTGHGGGVDAFVTKLNPAGSSLIYSTRLGGTPGIFGGGGSDFGNAIAVDSAGSAYIAGYTQSNDFPTVNPFQSAMAGGEFDAFVAKITTPSFNTPVGLNVVVPLGAITVTFASVTAEGNTTATPIDPNTAGSLPGGYTVFHNTAYDITTTATFTGAITESFNVPAASDPATFSTLRALHLEGGVQTDRTILPPDSPPPDFATKTISARTFSLSPFVIALLATNRAPIASCKSIEVTASGSCLASASASDVDNGSSDPDGDAITLSLDQTGPFGPGPHAVTLTVTDSHGASSSCGATVTVVDRTPPVITGCPSGRTLSAGSNCQAAIPNLAAEVSATDNCSPGLAITQSPAAGTIVGPGETMVTITARDRAGNQSSCSAKIVVIDATPPTVTASLQPTGRIEKREGKFVVGFTAADGCDPAPSKLAVMEIPARTAGFEIIFERQGGDEEKITFDLERQLIHLAGRNEAALRRLLAAVLADRGARVAQGQELHLQMEERQRFDFNFRAGVLIREKAPALRLKVTARDSSGNTAVATATAQFSR
jgi:beta-propeller repeat-containing protein/HYR domain-containing protein